MVFQKGGIERQMMADLYYFAEEFWKVSAEDSYWDGMLEKAEALHQKYKNNTFTALLVGFIEAKEKDYCDLTGRTRRPATLKWERVER